MMLPSNVKLRFRLTGQSLIEVIIGVTIAGLFILASNQVSNLSLITGSRNRHYQVAYTIAQELLDRVAIYADARWYCALSTCAATRGVYNLGNGSAHRYYLSNNPFEWREDLITTPQGEPVVVSGVTYNRYFYIEKVCRATSDSAIVGIFSGGCPGGASEDPSTQQVTAVVTWSVENQPYSFSLDRYLIRTRTAAVVQTDWSGGPWAANCSSMTANTFSENELRYACDDGNLTNNSPAGSIKVRGY